MRKFVVNDLVVRQVKRQHISSTYVIGKSLDFSDVVDFDRNERENMFINLLGVNLHSVDGLGWRSCVCI